MVQKKVANMFEDVHVAVNVLSAEQIDFSKA